MLLTQIPSVEDDRVRRLGTQGRRGDREDPRLFPRLHVSSVAACEGFLCLFVLRLAGQPLGTLLLMFVVDVLLARSPPVPMG